MEQNKHQGEACLSSRTCHWEKIIINHSMLDDWVQLLSGLACWQFGDLLNSTDFIDMWRI